MIPHQPHLVSASASPRRQELMKLLQIDFEVIASQAVEESQSNESIQGKNEWEKKMMLLTWKNQ